MCRIENILYIVKIKERYLEKLSKTTLKNGRFTGILLKSGENMVFELNASKSMVIIQFDWIEYMAPSEIFGKKLLNK